MSVMHELDKSLKKEKEEEKKNKNKNQQRLSFNCLG